MTRRLLKYMPLAALLLLAGCSTEISPIDRENSVWDKYFVGPLSDALDWFADLTGGQYGLSILIVTIIIRLVILPLTLKQYKSSKRMQEVQPELKKLQTKYKDDPKKVQEETMKLFQKEGVNPLAGCLPILVQMPILIALYNAIMRNEHIGEHTFLWMQLGEKDPYYVLPLLAALTTYIQQKMMAHQMTPQMQSLMIIFPVLIFVMAMNFAAALPLYWVFSNIFTVVQTYFIYGKPKPAVAAAEPAKLKSSSGGSKK
ncbi:membrane protein insertase YidC [Paenibacillus sp. YYML68]|uniref:YidC/Oxa1 family membrane protein insertase n=1 Tax=Paenibacillus sp. YYML68 TaxID=2909250 RepID=UPI002493AED5|nr:membrane protein insertase YidC [Paenibacillus sp. YYML68]